MSEVYLGVDGGGTKTAFVLVDGGAHVLAEATGPTTYYFGSDLGVVERVLREGVARVTAAAGIAPTDVAQAFLALPGYGESSADLPALDALPGRVLGHDRYTCGNDVVAGWAGALGGADGIDVVAGTGSIAYGEWRGSTARAGGWSEVFGDEGSGYWLAVQGLAAFARMSDGRVARGALHGLLRDAIGAPTDLDVISVVTNAWAGDRTRIAALSHVVVAAADAGDTGAQDIVRRAGEELAALVHAVRERLGAESDDRVPLSWSGGLFAAPAVLAAFRAALGPLAADLRPPLHGPVLGAALMAIRRAGAASSDPRTA